MDKTLQKYIRIFGKLRIDRAHGSAPHKPLLLISILQLVQNHIITNPKIYITPELVALFRENWSTLVTTKNDCNFALPFYHLKGDFWILVPKPGFENILMHSTGMRSFSSLNAAIDFAVISDDLFGLMNEINTNLALINTLLDIYFPETKSRFKNPEYENQYSLDFFEKKIFNENPEEYKNQIKNLLQEKNDEEIFIRGSVFKREIPKIYNNTCCISGMRIDSIINVSMIDACHIIPFSESYDDTVTNGIALCPNLHRAFDRGLISVNENYKVIVSSSFRENQSNYSIIKLEGKSILLPKSTAYFPSLENFRWHRTNRFK